MIAVDESRAQTEGVIVVGRDGGRDLELSRPVDPAAGRFGYFRLSGDGAASPATG